MQRRKVFPLLVVLATWMTGGAFAQTTSGPPAAAASVESANAAAPPANPAAPPSAPVANSEADLEKLVGPIALYPDPLLAVLLPASAYPVEIVQAARFVKDTNNIAKLDSQPWDDNVKALARFPDVIAKMDADIGWTSQLGQAFVDDQKAVMDAIQKMRGKAEQAGNLKSTPQQVVTTTNEVVEKTVEQQVVYVTNTIVQIQPSQPQTIYVPQYNPAVVYAPAPAYAYNPVAPLVTFGVGMAVGAAIANDCDWHSGGVYVGPRGGVAWGGGHHHGGEVEIENVNVNRTANVNRANGQQWQADPNRRTSTATASAEARGWGGGQASQNASQARTQASQNASAARSQASQNASAARSQGSQNASAKRSQAQQNTSAARSQASQNASAARSQASQNASAARSQASQNASAARSQASQQGASSSGRSSAFNSSGGAAQARASSARGSASRGGGGGGRRR